jgi:hypothetical protein
MQDRLIQAIHLGPLAMIRLRAEVLLDRIDDATPQLADREFLQRFDVIYEEDDDEG